MLLASLAQTCKQSYGRICVLETQEKNGKPVTDGAVGSSRERRGDAIMYRCLSGDGVIRDQMVVQPYGSMRALELSMSCMTCKL